jgi:hypothetical protein
VRTVLSVVILATLALPMSAEKKIAWENCDVVAQNVTSGPAGIQAYGNGSYLNMRVVQKQWNNVEIETFDMRIKLLEVGRSILILPVNGIAQYYRDGDAYVFLDTKNHKHKFSLVGMEKKR